MGEDREKDEAFVTLATNDTYALGCLVLGSSLRRVGTTRQLVVMVSEGVSPSLRDQLRDIFDSTVPVNVLDSSDTTNLELLGRPDLSVTFTKLHCWRLTQFKKCVFLDADTLVLQNIDELFERDELSAAPDAGWPDCFNSGVFVFVPSEETYRSLLTFAVTAGSFDGGDQGLLNLYFGNWATADIGRHLPFIYNVVSQSFYTYLPALKQFHDNVKVIHFIGPVKPWHHAYNTATHRVTQLPNTEGSQEFLQLWWDVFMDSVQPHLDLSLTVNVRLEHKPPPRAPQAEQYIPPLKHGFYQHQGHQLQQHQQDHHGHSDSQAEPTISYQVMYPYTPPDMDDWTTMPEQTVAEVPQSKIVEIPVVYRDYKIYETHYTEEPLTTVNPEMPPADHYFASKDIKGPEFTYNDSDRNSSHQDSFDVPHVESTETADTDTGHTQTAEEGKTCESLLEVSSEGQAMFNLGEESTEKKKEHAHNGEDENGNFAEKGGIVGDLAHLSISNDGGSNKSDFERRLQWEQGQADYLGVDKFDNIKARLDEKMAPVTPSGSKTTLEKE
ncbi:hypothetical protein BsWGS_09804 [Bradybaena similaris]